MALTLVIDNRERAVFEHFPSDDDTIVTAQMTVGDYAIISGDCIHEIFERKTLKDYADSIRDGRHENRKKMLSLRDEAGCRVYYIIEGDNPDNLIGGLPKTTIEASIFNLMSNHNIFVLYSRSQADTARLLLAKRTALANSLKAKKLTYPSSVADPIARLTAIPTMTYDCLKREFFESFKGIGAKLAEQLAKTYRVIDAIISPSLVEGTILVSGRKVRVSLPSEMEDRMAGLKVVPRAGALSDLLEEAFTIETASDLEDAIDRRCKRGTAKKIHCLLYHEYDG
jgi:ERCC4-type nuclease